MSEQIEPKPLRPWEHLQELVEQGEASPLLEALEAMSPTETALSISRLDPDDQSRLLTILEPADAADVLEDMSETQAVDIIEELPPRQAAAIIEELESDHVADLLGELDEDHASAILDSMAPDEAEEARQFMQYDPETAGGLMVSELLSFKSGQTVRDIVNDLQENREKYASYNVQYMYVVDDEGRLEGVLKIRDLLFPKRSTELDSLMIRDPYRVSVDTQLDDLHNFFEEHDLFGVPVVDAESRLVGVVLPQAVEEAGQKQSVKQFLGISGIIGGEEFRSMPLLSRSGRRLSWLSLNIVLNIIAASVIALYQDTLSAAIALAVFLPMVSDMSGCSGNQAVAVSMRELSLGLIRPGEVLRVIGKEASLGVLNGVALGVLLGAVAFAWQGNIYLGLVVGGALAANTIVAVSLGGLLPLVLKRAGMDPALVSSPLLTTVTDMCGFFFVLSFATLLLHRL